MCQTLHRGDFFTIMGRRKREAAVHSSALYQDSAGTALPVVAPFFGAGQAQLLPKKIEQCGARINHEMKRLSINVQRNVQGSSCAGIRRRRHSLGTQDERGRRKTDGAQRLAPRQVA